MSVAPAASTPQERKAISGTPKVCGVLSIIFASLVLLGGLMGTCGGFAGASMTDFDLQVGSASFELDGSRLSPALQAELVNLVKDKVGGIYLATGIISLVFTAMSAWLLALGIGQVGYKRWARGQTVTWGIAALVVLLGVTVYSMAVIGPAYQGILDEAARRAGSMHDLPLKMSFGNVGTFAGMGAAIFSIAIFAPYPIVLIALFKGDKARQAMTA
ncbi:MAG: hypothetical protein IT385_06235 [Deltaproteobacteria bacterium]|nr:hypothetical protein [Deltaproteobacteria bacterium]